MDTLRLGVLTTSSLRVLGVAAIGVGLRVAYRRAIRRCEAKIIDSYSARFEQITSIAKSVHPHLIQSIELSKAAVNRAKRKEGNGPEAIAALTRVSDKLGEAEEECNCALRALERSS